MTFTRNYILVVWLWANTAARDVKFPDSPKFLFGAATAAYQIEGAWNVSGKGENIWDRYTHTHPELIVDNSNGDIACDSYNKFREDVQMLKYLGVDFYRFSLSWSRILPTGREYIVNPDGIRYYNELINELIDNGIKPMVTIFHWDTPQPLQDLGGFANELFVNWFEEYVRVVFENFGDRVKLWVTFNEPKQTCLFGYGLDVLAPAINSSGIGNYLCAHNLLKSHARTWHIYDKKYRKTQNGKIGITLDAHWVEPISQSPRDIEAAERLQTFWLAWYSDPIFSKHGDYPQVMKDFIGKRSFLEGFKQSRLPKFTQKEVNFIRGTYDFFGFNHYSTVLGQDVPAAPIGKPSFLKDAKGYLCQDPSWPGAASDWLKIVPCGFKKLLSWIKNRYRHDPNLEIYITENGCSDAGTLNDTQRIGYLTSYLTSVKNAIDEGVNIKAYTVWSLLDNFEWRSGYTTRFGLYHVDFQDPNRTRTPKASVNFFKELVSTRTLNADDNLTRFCKITKTLHKCPPNSLVM